MVLFTVCLPQNTLIKFDNIVNLAYLVCAIVNIFIYFKNIHKKSSIKSSLKVDVNKSIKLIWFWYFIILLGKLLLNLRF